jgi:hypothetical protein
VDDGEHPRPQTHTHTHTHTHTTRRRPAMPPLLMLSRLFRATADFGDADSLRLDDEEVPPEEGAAEEEEAPVVEGEQPVAPADSTGACVGVFEVCADGWLPLLADGCVCVGLWGVCGCVLTKAHSAHHRAGRGAGGAARAGEQGRLGLGAHAQAHEYTHRHTRRWGAAGVRVRRGGLSVGMGFEG